MLQQTCPEEGSEGRSGEKSAAKRMCRINGGLFGNSVVLVGCVGNHEMISDKRPETNSLEYRKGSEPSKIKRVSYANTVMRNSKSEEMKE